MWCHFKRKILATKGSVGFSFQMTWATEIFREQNKNVMRIRELSKQSGFSKDTIRYYQSIHLFDGMVKKDENGYRNFSPNALGVLNLVKESKKYGFTLKEMQGLLEMIDGALPDKLNYAESTLLQRIEKNKKEIEQLKVYNRNLKKLHLMVKDCRVNCM